MTTRVGVVLLFGLALLVAACGSSATSAPSSEPGASSEPPASTEPAPSEEPASSAEPSTDGDGGVDLPSDFKERLVPPDSTVLASVSLPEGSVVTFSSGASVDELVDFYEAAFSDLGVEPAGKVETSDGVWWAFEAGALITVASDTSGQGKTVISITAADAIGG